MMAIDPGTLLRSTCTAPGAATWVDADGAGEPVSPPREPGASGPPFAAQSSLSAAGRPAVPSGAAPVFTGGPPTVGLRGRHRGLFVGRRKCLRRQQRSLTNIFRLHDENADGRAPRCRSRACLFRGMSSLAQRLRELASCPCTTRANHHSRPAPSQLITNETETETHQMAGSPTILTGGRDPFPSTGPTWEVSVVSRGGWVIRGTYRRGLGRVAVVNDDPCVLTDQGGMLGSDEQAVSVTSRLVHPPSDPAGLNQVENRCSHVRSRATC